MTGKGATAGQEGVARSEMARSFHPLSELLILVRVAGARGRVHPGQVARLSQGDMMCTEKLAGVVTVPVQSL